MSEPTSHAQDLPVAVPETDAAGKRPGRSYWQAQGLAELALSEFAAASAADSRSGQRRAFFLLAGY